MEGKKLPEMFRKPSVNFNQLADDALAYFKRNKRSYKTDFPRFANLKEWFGAHAAEELTPREIEHKFGKMGTLNVQSLSLTDVVELLLGILNRKIVSNPARSVTHRRKDNNRVRFLTMEEEKKLRRPWRPSGVPTSPNSIWQSIPAYGRVVNTVSPGRW